MKKLILFGLCIILLSSFVSALDINMTGGNVWTNNFFDTHASSLNASIWKNDVWGIESGIGECEHEGYCVKSNGDTRLMAAGAPFGSTYYPNDFTNATVCSFLRFDQTSISSYNGINFQKSGVGNAYLGQDSANELVWYWGDTPTASTVSIDIGNYTLACIYINQAQTQTEYYISRNNGTTWEVVGVDSSSPLYWDNYFSLDATVQAMYADRSFGFSGNVSDLVMVSDDAPIPAANFTVTSNTNIFNITVNGTFYNTVTGTIVTGLLDNATSLYNVLGRAQGYFDNNTLSWNVSNNLELTFKEIEYFAIQNVTDLFTLEVLNFSVYVNDTLYSTTNGTLKTNIIQNNLSATNDIVNLIFLKDFYINRTYTNYDTSNDLLNTKLYTLRAYATDFRGNTILPFDVLVGSSSYPINSTNRKMSIEAGTYTFYLDNSTYEFANVTETVIVNYTNPSLSTHNITFSGLYTYNSINFTFLYDDGTDTLVDDYNISVQFISDVFSYNYSTGTGSLYVSLLSPETYTVRYRRVIDSRWHNFYFTLTNRSHSSLTLYLTNYSYSITVTVYDQVTLNKIEGAIVYLQRYYQLENEFKTVNQNPTDVDGKAYFLLEDKSELYKFLVDYPFGIRRLETEDMYINANNINIYIPLTDNVGDTFFDEGGIVASLNYLTSDNTFTASWTDSGNVASEFCLYIKEFGYYSNSVINSSCSTSNSGSLKLSIGAENITYYSVLESTINGDKKVLKTGWIDIPSSTLNAGAFGIFMTVVLIILFTLLSQVHVLALILSNIGLILSKLFGLLPIEWGWCISIVIGSIILSIIISIRK